MGVGLQVFISLFLTIQGSAVNTLLSSGIAVDSDPVAGQASLCLTALCRIPIALKPEQLSVDTEYFRWYQTLERW